MRFLFNHHSSHHNYARQLQIPQVRDKVLKSLNETFDLVMSCKDVCFDTKINSNLPIKCEELRMSPNGSHLDPSLPIFFDPLGADGVPPPHPTHTETQEHLKQINQEWGQEPTIKLTLGDEAYDLIYTIEDVFRVCRRDVSLPPGDPLISLMHHAKWVASDNISPEIIADGFDGAVFRGRRWMPYAAWKARNALILPHTMIAVLNETREEDKLLMKEVRTILAVMITRLEGGSFPHHTAVPVSRAFKLYEFSLLLTSFFDK
ncbi:hypothetical protein BO78DRAFT_416329 [Aspergillus sclerotiicarbonarius CBS 121057]|uniref:Uncharacterized protein n=1 Tax=Aspergillus sclerotiicarbonarius (strain CBS 121057 / IBT 28362) TaxID=1448318 RepID=A0A319EGL2_ASPSB|nr:hypothetical protein BO78DRAFT_416329 [Aspergillus sclerotiicarbonarius CBS 121057]